VDEPVHEEARGAGDAAARAALEILGDPGLVDAVAQLRVEASGVRDADRLGVGAQLGVGELVLVLEEPVVHLPEAPLGARGLGRLRGERRARVQVGQGHVAEDE
jgi:hypothetical protein